MLTVLYLMAIAGLSLAITRAMIACSGRLDLVDHPNQRSSHVRATPRGGGVAIVITSLLAVAFGGATGRLPAEVAWGVCLAGGLVASVGFWDDLRSLSPRTRLLAQFAAGLFLLLAIGSPSSIDFGYLQLSLGFLLPVAMVVFVSWLVNLTNFMDGIDGLAAMECLFVLAAGGTLALLQSDSGLAYLCFTTAAAAAGFLVLNWSPARIFMGDVGSGFIGLIFAAALLLDAARDSSRIWVWLILLAGFLTDSTFTLLRRLHSGKRASQAHRSHAYQHAARRWGHARTTLAFTAINAFWLGPLAVLASYRPEWGAGLFFISVCPLTVTALMLRAGVDDCPKNFPSATPQLFSMDSAKRLCSALGRMAFSRAGLVISRQAMQLVVIILAGLAAFLLRFEFTVPPYMLACVTWGVVTWAIVKTCVFYLCDSRVVWRYFSVHDVPVILFATLVASVVSWGILAAFCPVYFPRSIIVLDFGLTLFCICALRVSTRLVIELVSRTPGVNQNRTLIYGAGAAGILLLREARENAAFEHVICGFIDDRQHCGSMIHGVRVLGSGQDLKDLVVEHSITSVLIAVPSATGPQMTRIIQHCHDAGVSFRTMPALTEVISGRGLTRQIRDVAVDDVLGRSSIELDRAGINAKLQGRVALVTGAAGSIGSELCRQIACCRPAALVALDAAETPLFHIERELRLAHPDLQLYAEVANIQNVQRLNEIFERHRPNVVYHAAAYKHVPMMEANVFEAIENNVIGTFNVGVAADRYGADDFVMISSDKAVRPTNIMGASKRVAELVIASLQNGGPRYVSVRFGNVLGSNGSVVPIFKQQIAAGGPVTVTHPEMRRFFMTIPEAVQLVLQASTMGNGGEIFVLDMGSPVKIVDLARQLIILSGLKPDEDIRIEFSGTRPGEKLYEELRFSDEEVLPTTHNKIKVFAGQALPDNRMAEHLARLRCACERRDLKSVLFELKEIEPDYNPSKEVLARAFQADLSRLADAINAEQAVVPAVLPRLVVSGD